jgi:hypothetical protein
MLASATGNIIGSRLGRHLGTMRGVLRIRPLRERGYVSVLQRISRSLPGDSTRRGTLRELALMPVDQSGAGLQMLEARHQTG